MHSIYHQRHSGLVFFEAHLVQDGKIFLRTVQGNSVEIFLKMGR